ncbi:hypothetical protein JCM11641_001307 [Rhodosporidiobolus odoratus]
MATPSSEEAPAAAQALVLPIRRDFPLQNIPTKALVHLKLESLRIHRVVKFDEQFQRGKKKTSTQQPCDFLTESSRSSLRRLTLRLRFEDFPSLSLFPNLRELNLNIPTSKDVTSILADLPMQLSHLKHLETFTSHSFCPLPSRSNKDFIRSLATSLPSSVRRLTLNSHSFSPAHLLLLLSLLPSANELEQLNHRSCDDREYDGSVRGYVLSDGEIEFEMPEEYLDLRRRRNGAQEAWAGEEEDMMELTRRVALAYEAREISLAGSPGMQSQYYYETLNSQGTACHE